MKNIDLHIHTNMSDGDLSIDDIIKISKNNQCDLIAITDHEYIQDYSYYSNFYGINIINGIEFNTDIRGLHILGYGIVDIDKVNSFMNYLHQQNECVSFELIERLMKRGYDISTEKIDEFLKMINIKYKFLDKRHITKYLIYKGYTKDVYDTYKNLIGRGTELYIPLKKIKVEEILYLIKSSGGISSLAHPFTLNLSDNELIVFLRKLMCEGLDGIEIINGKDANNKLEFYKFLSNQLKLIKTIGSDFHSLKGQNIGIECDEEIYDTIIEKVKMKRIY